ncbi:MAG: hypothetical protein E6J26_08810 [Chloroflexi bacterium]|nr:MAG: hypothetical protein E6J26_08810 [Chloroflexota bacterium]
MSNPNETNKPDLNEPELISIIEGPPPQFQFADETSLLALQESTLPHELARCDTRTFNGPKLVKRCRDAWKDKRVVMLEYKDMDGLKQRVEICGIRFEDMDDGTLLQLWVRLPVELQFISIDDESADEDEDEGSAGDDDFSDDEDEATDDD